MPSVATSMEEKVNRAIDHSNDTIAALLKAVERLASALPEPDESGNVNLSDLPEAQEFLKTAPKYLLRLRRNVRLIFETADDVAKDVDTAIIQAEQARELHGLALSRIELLKAEAARLKYPTVLLHALLPHLILPSSDQSSAAMKDDEDEEESKTTTLDQLIEKRCPPGKNPDEFLLEILKYDLAQRQQRGEVLAEQQKKIDQINSQLKTANKRQLEINQRAPIVIEQLSSMLQLLTG